MGDRVSIEFVDVKDREQDTVVLFNHWGGDAFVETAQMFINALNERSEQHCGDPITRREPRVMMVQFLAWLTKKDYYPNLGDNGFMSRSLYFGKDMHDGDNSDNGHYVLCAKTGHFVEHHQYNWETREQEATLYCSKARTEAREAALRELNASN